jgi:transcriptional regulator with XRE-family HTH domain
MKEKTITDNFIKESRLKLEMSQKELARVLFVSRSAVASWETENIRDRRSPNKLTIREVLRLLEAKENENGNPINSKETRITPKCKIDSRFSKNQFQHTNQEKKFFKPK